MENLYEEPLMKVVEVRVESGFQLSMPIEGEGVEVD